MVPLERTSNAMQPRHRGKKSVQRSIHDRIIKRPPLVANRETPFFGRTLVMPMTGLMSNDPTSAEGTEVDRKSVV